MRMHEVAIRDRPAGVPMRPWRIASTTSCAVPAVFKESKRLSEAQEWGASWRGLCRQSVRHILSGGAELERQTERLPRLGTLIDLRCNFTLKAHLAPLIDNALRRRPQANINIMSHQSLPASRWSKDQRLYQGARLMLRASPIICAFGNHHRPANTDRSCGRKSAMNRKSAGRVR